MPLPRIALAPPTMFFRSASFSVVFFFVGVFFLLTMDLVSCSLLGPRAVRRTDAERARARLIADPGPAQGDGGVFRRRPSFPRVRDSVRGAAETPLQGLDL